MPKLLRLVLFAFACAAIAQPLPPITAEQAVSMVEIKAGAIDGATTKSEAPGFTIEGISKSGKIRAVVDADAARVVSVHRGDLEIYTWPGIITVGHRGNVRFAPENTIAAFNKAIELGADLLEMDVRETKDGHLVIMHDSNLARTTSVRGNVAEMTLEEIKSADAGAKFSAELAGEKVPTFAEALEAIKGRALPDIDFKAGDPQKVIDTVRAAGLVGKVTLYCGDWAKLRKTIEIEPGFLIRPTAAKGLEGLPALLNEFDPPIVNIDWAYFSEQLVRDIHLAGKLAFVNLMGKEESEATMKRAIAAGADYIQTDRMDLLVPMLAQAR